jgi:hypothetical protein
MMLRTSPRFGMYYVFIVPDCIVSLQFCFLSQLRRTRGVYCQIFPTKSLSLCTNMYYTTNVPVCSHNVVEDHLQPRDLEISANYINLQSYVRDVGIARASGLERATIFGQKGASTSLSNSGRCVQAGSQPHCSLLTKPKNF